MLMSIIILSHNKPNFIDKAVKSVISQTYENWEAILIDSGVLYDSLLKKPWANDPRIKIIKSNETEEIRKTKWIASWCFNECFRRNLVNGELIMYLTDDDLLYANAFETFVEYAKDKPEVLAMYASQDYYWLAPDCVQCFKLGERRALGVAGKCCNGLRLDCVVDYAQLAHRRKVLDLLQDPWWTEELRHKYHADGIFMEEIGSKTPIYPIDIKVSANIRTPQSMSYVIPKWYKQ